MLVTRANMLGVDALGPDVAAATLMAYTDDAATSLGRRYRGKRLRLDDAMAGVHAVSEGLVPAAIGHLLLSAALLEWTATRTGLNAETVLRDVLGADSEEV